MHVVVTLRWLIKSFVPDVLWGYPQNTRMLIEKCELPTSIMRCYSLLSLIFISSKSGLFIGRSSKKSFLGRDWYCWMLLCFQAVSDFFNTQRDLLWAISGNDKNEKRVWTTEAFTIYLNGFLEMSLPFSFKGHTIICWYLLYSLVIMKTKFTLFTRHIKLDLFALPFTNSCVSWHCTS